MDFVSFKDYEAVFAYMIQTETREEVVENQFQK